MESTPDDNFDERPSKSQLKRDAQALRDLGKQLAGLPAGQLIKLNLDTHLLEAVMEARYLKPGDALRRQLSYVAKLLRDLDAEPIRHQLNQIDQQSRAGTRHFHELENWRDRVIREGETAINELVEHYGADRQQLRNLRRQALRETAADKAPAALRKLFAYLRDLLS